MEVVDDRVEAVGRLGQRFDADAGVASRARTHLLARLLLLGRRRRAFRLQRRERRYGARRFGGADARTGRRAARAVPPSLAAARSLKKQPSHQSVNVVARASKSPKNGDLSASYGRDAMAAPLAMGLRIFRHPLLIALFLSLDLFSNKV